MGKIKNLAGAGWLITIVTSLIFALVFNVIVLTSDALMALTSRALGSVAVSTVYSRMSGKIGNGKTALKKVNGRIVTRTMRGLGRTVASIPLEAAPLIGAGVVVGTAVWEVSDGCLTLADIEDLYTQFGIEPDLGDYQKACVEYKDQVDSWLSIFGDEKVEGSEHLGEEDDFTSDAGGRQ